MNVLITSAGRRVSLVKSFQTELRSVFQEGKVYTIDMNPELSAACNISDEYFKVPAVTDNNYITILLKLCSENNIKIIIPTIDTELLVLSEYRGNFQKYGIEIVISDTDFIRKCRDKRLIHKFFNTYGIHHPKEIDRNNLEFPLFIKPINGSASIDTYLLENESMLSDYHLNNEKLMMLEYLSPMDHDEFTVDLYYDRHSILKCIVPRKRIEIRAGEVSKGLTVKNEIETIIWDKLSNLKGLCGCITFQLFQNKKTKEVIGIEINPRFGGGYPLSYLAGANYPKWIIQEYLLNEEINRFNNWEDNLLMLRYDKEVLVHGFTNE